MSGRQDSNLRPHGPKPRALPTELRPDINRRSFKRRRVVPGEGVEPSHALYIQHFKCCASAIPPPRQYHEFYQISHSSTTFTGVPGFSEFALKIFTPGLITGLAHLYNVSASVRVIFTQPCDIGWPKLLCQYVL
jgi:hypothetical protein